MNNTKRHKRTAYQKIRDACRDGRNRLVLSSSDLDQLNLDDAIIRRAENDDEYDSETCQN